MEFLSQIEKIFAHGFFVSLVTIVSSLFILFVLNILVNQVIRKKFKKQELLLMKVKKSF